MDKPFKLTVSILTPMIVHKSLTLDALLAAAIFNRDGIEGEAANALLPLAFEDGVAKASCIQFPRGIRPHKDQASYIRALKKSDLYPEFYAPDGKRGETRGDYLFCPGDKGKNGIMDAKLHFYETTQVPYVFFYGVGDPDACQRLITGYLLGIGKKHTSGRGEIGEVFWEESEDYSWVSESGLPMRQLPVAVWEKLGHGLRAFEHGPLPMPMRYPYWETPLVPSVYPLS